MTFIEGKKFFNITMSGRRAGMETQRDTECTREGWVAVGTRVKNTPSKEGPGMGLIIA